MANKVKPGASWSAVILLLFFFFPVGIILLIKKVTSEKYAYAQNSKVMKTLGGVMIGIGIFYLIFGLAEKAAMGDSNTAPVIIMSLIFCGFGVSLVVNGKKFKKRAEKYNRYLSIINNRTEYSLDNIAAAYPTSYDQTCKDLKEMLNIGYFYNAYLDFNLRELVIPKVEVKNYKPVVEAKPVVVKCPGCGATNTINSNGINECEYCGLPL